MAGCVKNNVFDENENEYGCSSHQLEDRISIEEKEDLLKGIFVLDGEVDDRMAGTLIRKILDFSDSCPKKEITLYINSGGGSITAGMAIYDTIRFMPNKVCTIGVDRVSGISALILAAGSYGMRYVCYDTKVSLGQLFAIPYRELPPEIYTMAEKVCAVIAKHTGRDVVEVKELMITENWLSAEAAITFGMVDSLTTLTTL